VNLLPSFRMESLKVLASWECSADVCPLFLVSGLRRLVDVINSMVIALYFRMQFLKFKSYTKDNRCSYWLQTLRLRSRSSVPGRGKCFLPFTSYILILAQPCIRCSG
jgi:hypothetical protein